eukprot:CAMPEP_0114994010 /NCGR_PEP_ID=MMETSP0216-20121206/12871_1 /TAXON_ID=223996 /ORGANISM="Protocruzia adherens, Strain Boccale" /LENGTH=234 /DNA_ID=CAMNT_0002357763 /DNA_START=1401 /DNA_END=2102 /DNA_ORIENTATION=-
MSAILYGQEDDPAARLDTNNDGTNSFHNEYDDQGSTMRQSASYLGEKLQARFNKFLRAFRFFDKDHDGKIGFGEFAEGLSKLNFRFSKADMTGLFLYLNKSETGLMTYDEFCEMIRDERFKRPEDSTSISTLGQSAADFSELASPAASVLHKKKSSPYAFDIRENPYPYYINHRMSDNMRNIIAYNYTGPVVNKGGDLKKKFLRPKRFHTNASTLREGAISKRIVQAHQGKSEW